MGSHHSLWCPSNYKILAPGKLMGMASAEGVPRFFPQVASAPIAAQRAELTAAHALHVPTRPPARQSPFLPTQGGLKPMRGAQHAV